jgi:nuclear pore complex protein Nup107
LIKENFPYEQVSLRKSYDTIGRSINVMETTAQPHDDDEAMAWKIMRRQSSTYYELCQLVDAIEALSAWRTEENKYTSKVNKPNTVPPALKTAFQDVQKAFEPILKGILQRPADEGEAADLAFIHLNYVPEIVLAYNSVLHAAGNVITRDSLLDSMELSVAIADDKKDKEGVGNGLQESFVQAKRMRELVTSFAMTSRAMLILKAEGKPWKAGKERKGMDLGVWELGGQRAEV